jgi:hypothetical protein
LSKLKFENVSSHYPFIEFIFPCDGTNFFKILAHINWQKVIIIFTTSLIGAKTVKHDGDGGCPAKGS